MLVKINGKPVNLDKLEQLLDYLEELPPTMKAWGLFGSAVLLESLTKEVTGGASKEETTGSVV